MLVTYVKVILLISMFVDLAVCFAFLKHPNDEGYSEGSWRGALGLFFLMIMNLTGFMKENQILVLICLVLNFIVVGLTMADFWREIRKDSWIRTDIVLKMITIFLTVIALHNLLIIIVYGCKIL